MVACRPHLLKFLWQNFSFTFKGNIETKFDDPECKSRNVELRRRLELYANVLHCMTIPTIPTRHKNIDMILIRFLGYHALNWHFETIDFNLKVF